MIHIAYCFDKNYRQHFFASITSLCLNYKNPTECLSIHILTDQLDPLFEQQLNDLRSVFSLKINCYSLLEQNYTLLNRLPAHTKSTPHISLATYYRFFLLEQLNEEIDKILYLDADTIILSSIDSLFKETLDNEILAGVSDPMAEKMTTGYGIDQYINAGVLLIDLKKWRQNNISNQCIKKLNQTHPPLEYRDQCAINIVINQKKSLDSKWNQFITAWSGNDSFQHEGILHFITPDKPWHAWYENPIKDEYWKYVNVSPWKGAIAEKPSTVHQAMREAKLLRKGNKQEDACVIYEQIINQLLK